LNTQGAFIGGQANLFKPKEGYDEFKEGTRYVHRDTGKEIYYPEEKQTKPTTQYLPDEFNEKHGDYLVKWKGYQNKDGSWTKTDSDKFNVKESVVGGSGSGSGGRGENSEDNLNWTEIIKKFEESDGILNGISEIDEIYKNPSEDGKYYTFNDKGEKIKVNSDFIEAKKKPLQNTLESRRNSVQLLGDKYINGYKNISKTMWDGFNNDKPNRDKVVEQFKKENPKATPTQIRNYEKALKQNYANKVVDVIIKQYQDADYDPSKIEDLRTILKKEVGLSIY